MSDIFISYAREDRPRAAALAAALEAQGWSVWWDPIIPAGQTFRKVIRDEIGKARCMVVIWSRESVESNWVLDEASLGQRRRILVPVRIDDVEPPLGFGELHAADLTGWDGDASVSAFRSLVRDIAVLTGPAQQHSEQAARVEPPKSQTPFVREPAPRPPGHFRRRPLLIGVSLAALVAAAFVVSRILPGKASPEPPKTAISSKEGLAYVWIAPGEFWMGATPDDKEAEPDEKPRHRVRITKGFWMGQTPVTVAAFKRSSQPVPPAPQFNPNWTKEDHPIVNVTWDEARAYCEWAGGRLPTEAEWEYAARGGKDGLKYPWGNEIAPANANYAGSQWKGTSPVRSYPANAWGLYDMAGNVWEWAADWYGEDYYATLSQDKTTDDPRGPQSGDVRVLRGGSFGNDTRILRAAYRGRNAPGVRVSGIGFRCVREVVP